YLMGYFQKEKDLLLEMLLVTMQYKKNNMPVQMHLKDSEIEEVFEPIKRKELTDKEAEDLAKKILLELEEESEVFFVCFSIIRCLSYLECTYDKEIAQIPIRKSKNKNKA